ncbi:hypothetical protein [Mycobacteroides abscessus]|uniref:hypothetical protein n=1 Tax=Mycobacteroides abscessus TaxID=36809 RepID=UPI00266FE411|nr:hypothetical protein [Mycobacteroides abscessus]MDO3110442.1 hypothetical protein [Mycobacteroides abscessus subsp. abscessus]
MAAVTFNSPDDLLGFVRGLQATEPKPDPAAFKPTAGEAAPPLDAKTTEPPKKSEPKVEPKAEPKQEPDAPKQEPKPAPADKPKADPPKPSPKPAPTGTSGDPARNWNGTRFGTQMGVPPSAVRNLKSGETVAGIKGLGRAQWNAGQHHAKGAGNAVSKLVPTAFGKGAVKVGARLLPGVGSLYSAYAAWQAFKTGDVVGGVLNLVGAIPGPIGWIGMGAAAIWEFGGWGDPYPKWAEPDGSNTYMLPGVAKDEAGVTDADKAITAAQRSVFSFEDGPDGTVWDQNHPVALRLDSANVKAELDAWVTGITSLFAQIDTAMQQSGEAYFQKQRQTLQPHFKAMSDLKARSADVLSELKAASIGAGEAYKAVLDANAAIRDQLAEKGKIADQGPATAVKAQLEKALTQVTEAETKLGNILADTPAPVVNGTTNAPGTREPYKAPQEKPVTTTNPAPSMQQQTTPQNTTPKQETPKQDDTLSKLLNQLGQQAKANTPSVPTSGLGGGSPLGNSGLGGSPNSGTPLSQTKPEAKSEEPKKKLTDEKKPTDRKKEEVKPLTAAGKTENEKAQVKPETKPQAAPATAPVVAPAAAGAPAPAAQGKAETKPEKPNTDVDVKGQKTSFPDPKTAALARTLAAADPTHPVSLADAAKQAGLTPPVPGQDPGQQVPPSDAKPGDIMVAGEKKYMLLGDGKFYDLQDYKIVGADELPREMGDRAGYFRLNDPNPGQPAGTQPVSPQSQAAPAQPVANPTGAQPGPVAGPGGAPAPGMPPAAPGGVPSVGSPGVPKPGTPGAGPANASATDTGTGRGGPSVGGQRMDPAAVR